MGCLKFAVGQLLFVPSISVTDLKINKTQIDVRVRWNEEQPTSNKQRIILYPLRENDTFAEILKK